MAVVVSCKIPKEHRACRRQGLKNTSIKALRMNLPRLPSAALFARVERRTGQCLLWDADGLSSLVPQQPRVAGLSLPLRRKEHLGCSISPRAFCTQGGHAES